MRAARGSIKLGQALSIRTDLIPAAYALELRQLQDAVPPFPSDAVRAKHARSSAGGSSLIRAAYHYDFTTHSTNLIARLDPSRRPALPPPWPSLTC